MIYLDTSVVAPLYWQETLSETVEELIKDELELGLSQLVEIELASALSRRVRMGETAQATARMILERFQAHLDAGFYVRIALETGHYDLACEWIGGFTTPLRTLDALHLAIAAAHDIQLLTADQGLAESAVLLGVDVQLLRVPL